MRNLKQSHSAKKLERAEQLGFLNLQFAAKYQKLEWANKKNQKKSHSAERNSKGDPVVPSGFVSYVKN